MFLNNANVAHLMGLRSSIKVIDERQRQQYTLLQKHTKILQNLQGETQSLKAIIEKMSNFPGAEPGRQKKFLPFYPVETEDLDGLLEAVQVSSWSSVKN